MKDARSEGSEGWSELDQSGWWRNPRAPWHGVLGEGYSHRLGWSESEPRCYDRNREHGSSFLGCSGVGGFSMTKIVDLSLTAYWAKEMHLFAAKNEKCATLMRRRGYLRLAESNLGMVWHLYIHQIHEFETKNTQIHAGLGLPSRNYCVAPNEGFEIDWEGQNDKCEMDIHYIQHVWCSQIEVWVTLAV